MKPRCDCLNFCGDDPRLDRGEVRPCPTFQSEIESRALHDAAPDLLHALKGMVELVEYHGKYLIGFGEVTQARAAIRKAEGGKR